MSYRNPVLSGFHPDPSVCRVGEDFYLAVSSFEYFPGVPLFHSRDLVNWRPIGHALTRSSQLDLAGCPSSSGIWAPTLRYHDGVFYMITTNYNPNSPRAGKFLVTATDPAGEWSDPVFIDQPGIDPSLFFDDDGKVFVTSNEAFSDLPVGIYQAELDVATGELLTENRLIWEGTGGVYPEGPHLYRRGDWYYLLISEGGSQMGHFVSVSRSSSPWGPFESCPHNPILSHASRPGQGHPIQGLGHADLVEATDGSWWAVYLGFRHSQAFFYHLGRETFLSPVEWEDDWPVFKNPGRPDGTTALSMCLETLPRCPIEADPIRDFFRDLGPLWQWVGNPVPGSCETGSGGLCLRGTGKGLESAEPVAFVCRRQQHFAFQVQSLLVSAEGEAGLAVYYNPEHHYSIHRQGNRIRVLKQVGDIRTVTSEAVWESEEVVLGLRGDARHYEFLYGSKDTDLQVLDTGLTRLLSTEATPCSFTGVMIGPYAVEGQARFAWFEYEGREEA